MLKLTAAQLDQAVYAAREIGALEAAKDTVKSQIVRLELGPGHKSMYDPLGRGPEMDYELPAAVIREQIASRLEGAHKVLRELGIELLPPTN